MRVLVGCEENGKVRDAFAIRGHIAWSCDLLPTRRPGRHYQGDIMDAIQLRNWDLIILHPDCTKLSLSGNRWYGRGKGRHHERIEAIEWTVELWETAISVCDKVVLENPTSVIFKHLRECEVQYIHPWQYGHGETKKTGLALHNVPHLIPTNEVAGREQKVWKMPPSEDRKRLRSETYDGWCEAFATQWGCL